MPIASPDEAVLFKDPYDFNGNLISPGWVDRILRPSPIIRTFSVYVHRSSIRMHRPRMRACDVSTIVGPARRIEISDEIGRQFVEFPRNSFKSLVDSIHCRNRYSAAAALRQPVDRPQLWDHAAFHAIAIHGQKQRLESHPAR